ncbi:MAG TPA: 4-alpha-glucanotransferase [Tepidisphaeraceae bacterium]|nr:4-alpha-glucanotransferase [Tepidisphaeraceae bacterium]
MARRPRGNIPALSTRSAGILLHPTSLPGPFAAGDLGPAAHQFADSLKRAGVRWWQMLPTSPPGPPPGFSPYSSHSAFAGSAWLISPELLFQDGLISRRDLTAAKSAGKGRIDFARQRHRQNAVLARAYANSGKLDRDERKQFAHDNADWLEDFALYSALKSAQNEKSWLSWPAELRLRKSDALAAARKEHADAIEFQRFIQWIFDRQWTALKKHCNSSGIGLIGDVPIFVSDDSADVWANRRLFLLGPDGKPTVVSGYPADPFSPLGQKWNHPHYRWPVHIAEKFAWWRRRFAKALRDFDAVRIDHFLGFYRLWAVPAKAPNAIRGKWLPVPGDQLFAALRGDVGDAPIIAEDLGSPVPQQLALRDKFKFPGMRILQFAFGEGDYHRPHVYPRRCVAYTGTHDNPTIAGWWETRERAEKFRAAAYVGRSSGQHWNFIRALFASVAHMAIIPVQDALGLGAAHRMNVPGVEIGNWGWRMSGPMPKSVEAQLRALAEVTGRI